MTRAGQVITLTSLYTNSAEWGTLGKLETPLMIQKINNCAQNQARETSVFPIPQGPQLPKNQGGPPCYAEANLLDACREGVGNGSVVEIMLLCCVLC